MKYTDQEIAEQTVRTGQMLAGGASHRDIAAELGIGLATVHERRRAAAALVDRVDLEHGTVVRREAAAVARSWIARLEDAYADGHVDPLAASKEVRAWTARLAKLYGADAPVRVDVNAAVDFGADRAQRDRDAVRDAIVNSLDDSAREFADGFAAHWGLPPEAADALYRRVRPWRPSDDFTPDGTELRDFTVPSPDERYGRRNGWGHGQ